MTDPLLRAENLRKSFGGLVAVDGATFEVEEGTIVGLIGPNGAGKSTTFNLLSGFHDLDGGEVVFEGESVGGLSPAARAQRGMVRTFQITRELTGMRVTANMLLAAQDHPGEKVLPALVGTESVEEREERARERAADLLKFLDLWELRDEYAGNLSGGQRKLLELGRALMADPDLLLLDEPVAGVNPELTDRLLARIDDLQSDEGMTFVVVEHDMDVIMSISDKVIGMHNGEVLSVGTPEEVKQDERMLEAYLGGMG